MAAHGGTRARPRPDAGILPDPRASGRARPPRGAERGKPISAARAEIDLVANVYEYWGGAANKIFGETIPVVPPGLDVTLREPVGVCVLIAPLELPDRDRELEDRAGARVWEHRDA